MPVFEYTAINSAGKNTKGLIDAENIRVARQRLRTQGVFPTDIKESSKALQSKSRDIKRYLVSDRVSLIELAVATRQLATLIGAGLPLVNALAALSEQTESETLKRTVVTIREKVEQGDPLARTLAGFPKIFPGLYVNMVQSGEASGTLDTVLNNLATYLEGQIELRRKVQSALTYPLVMLVICGLVIAGLLVFVVPQIVEIFKKRGMDLPVPTRITLFISNSLIHYWYLLIALGFGAFFYFRWFYKTVDGRARVDRFLLKMPMFGAIYTKVNSSRVTSTLGTLLSSGVGLLAALDISRNIVQNVHLAKALDDAKEGVREGRSLAREVAKSGFFPPMVSHMIAVGEKSGELESMLVRTGLAYEKEVNATLGSLTALIQPLLLVLVGFIVFGIVVSVLLPMVDLIGVVQQ